MAAKPRIRIDDYGNRLEAYDRNLPEPSTQPLAQALKAVPPRDMWRGWAVTTTINGEVRQRLCDTKAEAKQALTKYATQALDAQPPAAEPGR